VFCDMSIQYRKDDKAGATVHISIPGVPKVQEVVFCDMGIQEH